MRTGVPCNENRFFPVRIYYTGKTLFWPCTGPVWDCSVHLFLASERCFWPLPAFMRSEVKKNHAPVLPYRILNKSHEINLSIGCAVWPCTLLSVRQDILELLMRLQFDIKSLDLSTEPTANKVFPPLSSIN